ncbi:MAG: sensor histidine kinase [Candidatus Omnitrophica bacterium]|nr:sensor histidine kinase [Candidatus Omnitrophota bacterium]
MKINKKPRKDLRDISFATEDKSDKEFYKKVLIMQEEEKRKLSRDLHDETGQVVVALGALLNVIEKEVRDKRFENVMELITEGRGLIQEIANKMKIMAVSLRPPALDILGLPAVLRDFFSQCTKAASIKIEFNENMKDIKLNKDTEITLYRIIQEAIYNIQKHSMAKVAKINLICASSQLQLFIEDNGVGFDTEEYKKQYDVSKMGLRGIRERVDILNGTFSIDSAPNRGTKLTIMLPLEVLSHGD